MQSNLPQDFVSQLNQFHVNFLKKSKASDDELGD